MVKSILVQQTSAGEPVSVGGVNVFPVSRSYRIDFPAGRGGLLWNRPLAIIVENEQGEREVIPVQDRTRLMQVGILFAGILGSALVWLILGRSSSNNKKRRT